MLSFKGIHVSERYAVRRPTGPIDFTLRPPGSKSITNRALVCAALASGVSRLSGVLCSEDTRVMIDALGVLGVEIKGQLESGEIQISGTGGRFTSGDHHLEVANSGTTMRFLSSVACLGEGCITIDGITRMRERPILPLVEALRRFGVDIQCGENGCPPVVIKAGGLPGGSISVDGSLSSQFVSGLLLAAPLARDNLHVQITGQSVSRPYLNITTEVMKAFGIPVTGNCREGYRISAPQEYTPCDYSVEPDATAASYLLAIPAIAGGKVTVTGLGLGSIQGDIRFVDCLSQMGCEVDIRQSQITVSGRARKSIDVDMNDISDTAQTLAVIALFVEGQTTIRNIGHNRLKETDRIGHLATELRRLGGNVEETDDGLVISAGRLCSATVNTYDDHRMAMSLALAGLKIEGVVISDPGCIRKTYPDYFRDLEAVTGGPRDPSAGGDS